MKPTDPFHSPHDSFPQTLHHLNPRMCLLRYGHELHRGAHWTAKGLAFAASEAFEYAGESRGCRLAEGVVGFCQGNMPFKESCKLNVQELVVQTNPLHSGF